ncbi:MAG: indolepyruvate oxidoreductase subunit beta [Thermoproteus sp.]|nr:indolepyruvate oxidoreductase subunit beta [Thermoproteus sp.]
MVQGVTNVVVAGVGGQGIMTLARWLGRAAAALGLDVRIAEVHGLSQRGGSVEVHLRFGERVRSPTISEGDADYVLALEALEALRAFRYLKQSSLLISNKRVIQVPGRYVDPSSVFSALGSLPFVRLVPAYDIALKLGDPIYENAALLGYAATVMGLAAAVDWLDERNARAFREGAALAAKA